MAPETPAAERPAVIVTGASSGIGQAVSRLLAQKGFVVFAGVRSAAAAQAWTEQSVEGVRPILLDVTDRASIASAVAEVTERLDGGGLAGLVNNAGIVIPGPLEVLPLEAFRQQLEVNVVGTLAVTQAFLPLIRQGAGRIINIGSISGLVSSPLVGAYAASKFALEALTQTLRLELQGWGIPVVMVAPGNVATPIWDKSSQRARQMRAALPPAAEELYGPQMDAVFARADQLCRASFPAEKVARTVYHILTVSRPRLRYLVGADAWAAFLLQRFLPQSWLSWWVRRWAGLGSRPTAPIQTAPSPSRREKDHVQVERIEKPAG